MLRRDLLVQGLGAGLSLGLAGWPCMAQAQKRPFTFCSWGGALSDAEKSAFTAPFAAAKGVEIVNT